MVQPTSATKPLKTYRDLQVWQRSVDLVEEIYRVTASFPPDERYGLTSQLRRAAVSIPSNIAEGYCRKHRREYQQHLSIARGSLGEIETQLIIAVRLDHITRENTLHAWEQCQEVGRMLNKLITSLTPGT